MSRLTILAAGLSAVSLAQAQPQYQIYDIGVLQTGDSGSQAFRVSNSGIAVGRSLRTGAGQAFSWTVGGGMVGLPNLAGRPFGVANGVNNSGVVVGTGSQTAFGSGPLPVMWQNGVATQLTLPDGQSAGRATDINNLGVAVGSVNGGSLERAVYYSGNTASLITATTGNGRYFVTAYGINDSGMIVGQGWDPNNAAVTAGLVYFQSTNQVIDIGALPGQNSAISFDVSEAGHVVGSSSLNGGAGLLPFIWTQTSGIQAVPLPTGTSTGQARGVNSNGWVVGTASSAFAIPFLYDGNSTYRMQDVLVNGAGWDLATNTSSSAMSINDNGMIVGTGVFNGVVHAYAAVPVPEPATMVVMGLGALAVLRRRSR